MSPMPTPTSSAAKTCCKTCQGGAFACRKPRLALRVLIATPLSDCHSVSPKLLETHLAEHGYRVRNLGACCSTEEIAQGAATFKPDAILLCAQNGHALMDLRDLPAVLARYRITPPPTYIGGNVTVGAEKDLAAINAAFSDLGIEILGSFEDALGRLQDLRAAKTRTAVAVAEPTAKA